MFSFKCKSCKHPALMSNLRPINRWMNDVIVIFKDGERVVGQYDGYGGLGEGKRRFGFSESFTLYHQACEEVLGAPQKYAGKSLSAADQGHFYKPGAHDMPDPRIALQRKRVIQEIEANEIVQNPAAADDADRSEYFRQLFVATYDVLRLVGSGGMPFGDDQPRRAHAHRAHPIEDVADAERGRFGYDRKVTLKSIEAALRDNGSRR